MSFNLDAMTREELLALQADVDKALKTLDSRRKAEALRAVQDAAREYGFSLNELTDGKAPTKKAAPKYANPEDPSQTWSGRGRQPIWFREAIAAGVDPEKLSV